MLALHVRGDAFTAEEKVRDFAYYEALTVRDSSLSACTQAVVAAELGHLQLAYDYFAEAARMDLEDLEHNTRDGLHIASLAGCWIAAVAGFGGLRDHDGRLAFAPRLPLHLERLSFRLRWRGSCILVAVEDSEATYELLAGDAVQFTHYGEPAELSPENRCASRFRSRRNRPRSGSHPAASRVIMSRPRHRERPAFAGAALGARRLVLDAEAVSHRSQRVDRDARLRRADLAAQIAHIYVNHVGLRIEVIAPDGREQLLA